MTTTTISIILTAVISYFIGGFLAAELTSAMAVGRSPFTFGSRNPGAANVAARIGLGWGIATAVLDAAKYGIAAFLTWEFAPCGELPFHLLVVTAGCVLGHCFPLWNLFRGGKGVTVTCVGLICASPLFGSIACAAGLAVALITKRLAIAAIVIPAVFLCLTPLMGVAYAYIPAAVLLLLIFIKNIAHVKEKARKYRTKLKRKHWAKAQGGDPASAAAEGGNADEAEESSADASENENDDGEGGAEADEAAESEGEGDEDDAVDDIDGEDAEDGGDNAEDAAANGKSRDSDRSDNAEAKDAAAVKANGTAIGLGRGGDAVTKDAEAKNADGKVEGTGRSGNAGTEDAEAKNADGKAEGTGRSGNAGKEDALPERADDVKTAVNAAVAAAEQRAKSSSSAAPSAKAPYTKAASASAASASVASASAASASVASASVASASVASASVASAPVASASAASAHASASAPASASTPASAPAVPTVDSTNPADYEYDAADAEGLDDAEITTAAERRKASTHGENGSSKNDEFDVIESALKRLF